MYYLLFYTKMLLLNNLYTASGHRELHNSTMKMKEKLKTWKSGTTACQHESKIHIYMRGLFLFHDPGEGRRNTRHH